VSLADDRLIAARAAIAAVCLDALPDAVLGDVRLRDDQRRIVARAQRALGQHGGCLIAEEVGRGKTYVALALARRWQHPLVVAPASLLTTWTRAAQRAGVACVLASQESLSRGHLPSVPFDGIVVDESHHFRTLGTRRHAALAELAARAPIVMLSATPLQNRVRDLAAQLALYLGEMAFTLGMPALSRFVIRGDDEPDAIMPMVTAPEWIDLHADDGLVLRAILDLSPPAKPLDAGDAGALRTIGLVRAWASSRAALEARLRSRRRLASAVEQGVEAGRAPTRREARAWHGVENVVQLGFASMLIDATPSAGVLGELRAALECERATMSDLASVLRATPDPDLARVCALRQVRSAHPGLRIIAFSEFASTITAFYSAMRGDAGVGMLTARDARIASGRIPRDELLARFAPLAQHARPVAAHESVTLLLTTDLLSEGVNLQDASIVVHLDLPWNPARLAQRVGRVRRPGGASVVHAYLFSPPARAAELLDADARLRRKLAAAEHVVGHGIHVLPALSAQSVAPPHADIASADAQGAFTARLERWRSREPVAERGETQCVVAAVESNVSAWLAALDDGRVICSLNGRVSDSVSFAVRVADLLEGPSRIASEDETRDAIASLHSWLDANQLAVTCGLDAVAGPHVRVVLHWLDALARELPRHERATALPLVVRLREGLMLPLPLGAERALAGIASRRIGGSASDILMSAIGIVKDALRNRDPVQSRPVRPVALVIVGGLSS
jgi:superfamily II DNA or RNA helicase